MRHEDVLGDVLAIDAKTMQMHRQSRGGGRLGRPPLILGPPMRRLLLPGTRGCYKQDPGTLSCPCQKAL